MIAAHTLAARHPLACAGPHDDFLNLQPIVERHAKITFQGLPPQARAEAIAEAVAAAFVSFVALKERGKDPLRDFPSQMATFGVLHVRDDRHVGGPCSSKDVLSWKAQQKHGFQVESLPTATCKSYEEIFASSRGQRDMDMIEERLHDNVRTPPADAAAFRIDFPCFLERLTERDRDLALYLSLGHSNKKAAEQFHLSEGRVTQLRVQWCREWYAWHGEKAPFEERASREKVRC